MSLPSRLRVAVALVGVAATGLVAGRETSARAEPPAAAGAAAPEGISWERDLAEGLARAAREGRPVFFAVNALLDEGEKSNVAVVRGAYASPAMGEATRAFVCFVANAGAHAPRGLADGAAVCSAYGSGTCAAHRDALTFLLARFTPDGRSLFSPSHLVLEPDGGLLWRADTLQATPTPADLDAFLVATSPRRAAARAWTAREARMKALLATAPDAFAAAATAWAREGDPLAPAGLCALLDEAREPARRRALLDALLVVGAPAVASSFGFVHDATSRPGDAPEEALDATAFAVALDPVLGAHAAGRYVARGRDAAGATAARTALVARLARGRPPAGAAGEPTASALVPDVRAAIAEALASCGASPAAAAGLDALPAARRDRLTPIAGSAPLEPSAGRDALRTTLARLSTAAIGPRVAEVTASLAHASEEVRVAAALALVRAGKADARAVEIVLEAVGDPVEGPEARATLAALEGGEDLGESREAWDAFVRERAGGGR